MTFTSYSQNFEDVLLWRALRDIEKGHYVDIGAQDPTIDSVSLAFYERGWRGIHVEPVPAYATRLRELRGEDAVIEAAVTDEEGPILLYELGGLTSGKKEIADHHQRAGCNPRLIYVPTVRLDHLLDLIGGEIHWLKIDVEGMEADVLRSWGTSKRRPWVLLIESTFPNSQIPTQQQWIEEVEKRDYEEVFYDGLSRYFVHKSHRDIAKLFEAPANLFDDFAIGKDHFAARTLRDEIEEKSGLLTQECDRSAELESVLAETRHSLESMELERCSLSRQYDEAMQQAAEASRTLHTSQIELARLEERCAQLQDKLRKADEALQRAEDRAASAKADFARQAAERDQTIAGLEATLSETKGAAEAAQRQLADEIETLKASRDREIESLIAKLAQAEDLVAAASNLIAAAGSERTGHWQNLGELLGLARSPASKRALAAWNARLTSSAHHTDINSSQAAGTHHVMLSTSPTGMKNPYLRADSLAELLSWHDVDFVRCAYVTILGRQPDPDGEAHYTDKIRQGMSKKQILWELRTSREGPRHDPGIAGLDRALRRARRARTPFLGAIYRAFSVEEGDSSADRRRRAIANEIGLLRNGQDAGLYRLQVITSTLQRLEGRMQSLEERVTSGHAVAEEGATEQRASSSQRQLTDPIDLSSAKGPDEAIGLLKTAINASREVDAFRTEPK